MAHRTELNSLGRAKVIERLTSPFSSTVISGVGDDCAVIDRGSTLELISKTLLMEGIDFDLSYTPLEHLGLKAVGLAISNIVAMNGTASYIVVGVALSARFSMEEMEALYRGVGRACDMYGVELIGGDTASSITGLTLSVTAVGEVAKHSVVLRSGASPSEILCSTGTLGAAYMGLQLLEREKRAGATPDKMRAIFEDYKFILNRQLQPTARVDIVELLAQSDIVPTSMIDISSGLSSAVLSLCTASGVGARVHLNKLAVNSEVSRMAEELNADPVVAMLNGGDDCELLFTLPASLHDRVKDIADIAVIGFTTEPENGAAIVTPDGEAIQLTSPDYTSHHNEL